MNLSTRDGYAVMLAAGVKLGGGSWSQAGIWFLGSRLIMNFLGFPDETAVSPSAQGFLQDVGSFCQRIFGSAPPQSVPTVGGDFSQTIDAEYQEYGTQTQS